MRFAKSFAASAIAALAVLAGGSPATTTAATTCDRYASPSGSDSNSGTLTSPYRTAPILLDSLTPGQTGCLRAGTYSSTLLSIETEGITLAPYGSEDVTIVGMIQVNPSAPDVTVEGLRIVNSGQMALKTYAHRTVVQDSELTNNDTSGSCLHVKQTTGGPVPDDVVIRRNIIHDCGDDNLDHGIYVATSSDVLIEDNWIYSNWSKGVQLYGSVQRAVVRGNVIADDGRHGMVYAGQTQDSHAYGNVFAYNPEANAYDGDPSTGSFHDNCVWQAGGSDGIDFNEGITSYNNRVAEPQFVSRAVGDYALQAGSPCLAKYTGTMSLPDSVPPVTRTLSVQVAGSGSGSATGSGINCPGDCSQSFPDGEQVTLTATATNGSTFAGWSGACSGTGSCAVTLDADKSVTATFDPAPAPAPEPEQTTSLLRPNVDLKAQWQIYGAADAWRALDDPVTTATDPGRSDYIQAKAADQVTTVGFTTSALGGAVPKAATLWYYGRAPRKSKLELEVRWGGQTHATQVLPSGSSFKWRSVAVAPPDQGAVDDLNMRVNSLGGRDTAVRAAYIQLDT